MVRARVHQMSLCCAVSGRLAPTNEDPKSGGESRAEEHEA